MKHRIAMTSQIGVILSGILVIVWMFASHPAEGQMASPQASPGGDPYIQGDVSSAAWSARCFVVPPGGEESAVDPILHWGVGSTAPHTHEFFAQTTIFSTTSPGALMSPRTPIVPPVNCYGPTVSLGAGACTYDSDGTPSICDRSAYWVPELLYDETPTDPAAPVSTLVPAYANIYWRNEYTDPTLDSPFPEDLAMVAGDATATTPQDIWNVNWQCVSPLSAGKWQTPGRYSSTVPSSCLMPSGEVCPPGHGYPNNCFPVYLRMVITFPECVKLAWNSTQGMYIPTAVHYGESDSPTPPPPDPSNPNSYINCPPSVSVPQWLQIPQIQVDPHWRLNNLANSPYAPRTLATSAGTTYVQFDLSKLLLSSDLMMDQSPGMASVTPGTTSHADYVNGYVQGDIDSLMTACFYDLAAPNCGSQ